LFQVPLTCSASRGERVKRGTVHPRNIIIATQTFCISQVHTPVIPGLCT
jgi:hypothetical protein